MASVPSAMQRVPANDRSGRDAQDVVKELAANELIFGVVGPVGSGTSEVAEALSKFIGAEDVEILKARDFIKEAADKLGIVIPREQGIEQTIALQDAGDAMRKAFGHASVAVGFAKKIREIRARRQGRDPESESAITPDGKFRVYILDSLRHPAEVMLLRRIYQQSFCLIAVVCDEDVRVERLADKYGSAGKNQIKSFMLRDEKASEKYGQQVSSTFHLADFFVENSQPRNLNGPGGLPQANPNWTVQDELGRLVSILRHDKIVRPRPNETAMYHAYGARMRSACLSRQVGAALLDRNGNLLATGTNEVPRAGGGVYGGSFDGFSDRDPDPAADHRCYIHGNYCRNTREQNDIIKDLSNAITEIPNGDDEEFIRRVRGTRIGQLIEFSRAVHAEMDALFSAAREGVSTVGSRLFVTTYPCHNCARHIVVAGVDEVQFIEPYLKSRALPLHGDSITDRADGWIPPSEFMHVQPEHRGRRAPQVLFRPFTGVAPRMYRKAFYKDRDLKNGQTGAILEAFSEAEGEGVIDTLQLSYSDVEALLVGKGVRDVG